MKTLISAIFVSACALSFGQCCDSKKAEDAFMKEAQAMMLKAEGKKACCKSTVAKVVVKGDKGCCNAPGEKMAFKVFVAGSGYKTFGCSDSAAKGRQELMAQGVKVGPVQKISKA